MTNSDFKDLHWLLDIIQSTDIGILVLDKQFNIEVYNRFMQVHSGIGPEQAIGSNIFKLFPYLEDEWFKRKVHSVFDLGIPVYTTWEQRDNVFDFFLNLPIHHETYLMYQNTTFVPLRSAADEVEKVGIIVYDVTESAVTRSKLEQAKDDLLKLSRTDRLTALWNRGYWEERLNEEFTRCKRTGNPATVVMFDIDHFKRINDDYGHQVGDEAIRTVSRLTQKNSREVDICGRYGGEEFAVILPETDIAGAFNYCERLRKTIEEATVSAHGVEVKFTISLGIAKMDESTKQSSSWLNNADKALYQSKEGGRNRTTVFGSADAE